MKIALIGATGMLGRPVAEYLLSQPDFEVSILARNVAKAQSFFPQANILFANLQDPASLHAALQGQEAVYLSLSVEQTEKYDDFHTETDGLQNVLEVAKHLGIKRIAYLSSIVMRYQGMNGFRWWVFELKQQAVKMIKESGIPYLIFYPSTFMECFPYQQTQGSTLGLIGQSKHKMWFIAAADYARQVAQAFRIVPTHESKVYAMQGPEGHTYQEAGKMYAQTKKLRVITMPLFVAKFLGMFNQRLNYAERICNALNNYPEKFVSEKTWDDLGKPTITLREFTKLEA